MKILNEADKNLKIVFRSLSSVSMLVIGPLLLILLIGFAFSGNQMHGVKVGLAGNVEKSLLEDMKNFSSVAEYERIENCVEDLRLQNVHLCLDFTKGFGKDENGYPAGTINFYYDNTRTALSTNVINAAAGAIGTKSEQISIESMKVIFGNIQELVMFIAEKQQDIGAVKEESANIRARLAERKERLIEIKTEFDPKYKKIKEMQNRTITNAQDFYAAYLEFIESLDELTRINNVIERFNMSEADKIIIAELNKSYEAYPAETDIKNLEGITRFYFLSDFGEYAIINDSLFVKFYNTSERVDISNLDEANYMSIVRGAYLKESANFKNRAAELKNRSDRVARDTNLTVVYLESITKQLDDINELLNQEIILTDMLINAIDSGTKKIDEIDSKLSNDIEKLKTLHPELATKLINPVTSVFSSLIPDIAKVKNIFPTLLAAIIIFISILFSNNITLSEIHSSAHFRNVIAPVSDKIFTMGIILTDIIAVSFQAMALLLIGDYRFGIAIFDKILPVALVSLLMVIIFSLIGMLIAFAFKNQQTSLITSTMTALGFFLFSAAITPLEMMPRIATYLAGLNPMVIAESIFRRLMLLNIPIGFMQEEVMTLGIYTLVLFVFVMIASKNMKKI